MNKRGQAEQFNWIFVSVVGIIILLFILGFLVKYIDLQESKQNAEMSWKFSNSILKMKSSENYKEARYAKDIRVDYNCDSMIFNKDVKFGLPYAIFTEGFKSNELIFWVEDFRYDRSFLVDRVVFILDNKKKYYFDEEFRNNLPPIIELVNKNDADVIVSTSILSNQEGVKKIYVDKINKKIKFVDSDDTFNYDNDMFIYGAAFSNARTFKCTKDRLENRSLELNDLYIEKISQGYFGQPGQCDVIYASMSNDLLLNDHVRIAQDNNNLAEFNCEVIF